MPYPVAAELEELPIVGPAPVKPALLPFSVQAGIRADVAVGPINIATGIPLLPEQQFNTVTGAFEAAKKTG